MFRSALRFKDHLYKEPPSDTLCLNPNSNMVTISDVFFPAPILKHKDTRPWWESLSPFTIYSCPNNRCVIRMRYDGRVNQGPLGIGYQPLNAMCNHFMLIYYSHMTNWFSRMILLDEYRLICSFKDQCSVYAIQHFMVARFQHAADCYKLLQLYIPERALRITIFTHLMTFMARCDAYQTFWSELPLSAKNMLNSYYPTSEYCFKPPHQLNHNVALYDLRLCSAFPEYNTFLKENFAHVPSTYNEYWMEDVEDSCDDDIPDVPDAYYDSDDTIENRQLAIQMGQRSMPTSEFEFKKRFLIYLREKNKYNFPHTSAFHTRYYEFDY